jgi:hypothetical protein
VSQPFLLVRAPDDVDTVQHQQDGHGGVADAFIAVQERVMLYEGRATRLKSAV